MRLHCGYQTSEKATAPENKASCHRLASLLYFAAIAAALVRHGQRISKLDPDLLRQAAQLMLDRPWVGEPLRALFQEVVACPEPRELL